MNEHDLINRLQRNIKVGTNSCVSMTHSPVLGPGSNIHETKPEEVIEEVKKAIENAPKVKADTKYEMVNHPKHYNNYDVEVVDMMEKIWGTKATMEWCKMTAYKYRMRMGTKPGDADTKEAMKNKLLEDFNKEQWYLAKADELKGKLFDKSIDMNQ